MKVIRIRDWDKHFENNRTRDLKRMDWVPMPVKHDGDGYTELLDHPNGASHFGAWCAIVEVAAKCDPRGTLLREGGRAHDSDSLARLTRISRAIVDEAIERLLDIGWLESVTLDDPVVTEIPHEGAGKPHDGASSRARAGTERNGTEGNGTEGKKSIAAASPPTMPAVLTFPTVGGRADKATEWPLQNGYIAELSEAFPDIDILAECRKALAWVRAKSSHRKTADGMKKFLFSWMGRVQDRGKPVNRDDDGFKRRPPSPEEVL